MSTTMTATAAGHIHARSLEERMQWLARVCRSDIGSVNAVKLAVYLFECCNSVSGQCNPSRSTIERSGIASNARRAIRDLEKSGLIKTEIGKRKSNQYYLVLRTDIDFQHGTEVSQGGGRSRPIEGDGPVPEGGDAAVPYVGDSSVPQTFSSEPVIEPGKGIGSIPDEWRPSDRDIDFASMSGMNNKEVELQVPLFIQYNQEIRKNARSWSLNWRRWVTAWKRKQIEDVAEPPSGDRINRSLKAVLADDRPCWERYGGARTPVSDPAGFVRSGCSLFGGCQCSEAERRKHADRAGGRRCRGGITEPARMAS